MTNQAEPMPFLPPIYDVKTLKACMMQVAMHLNQLNTFAAMTMFRLVTGFPDLPAEKRLAFYISKNPIEVWLSTPQIVPTLQPEIDPMTQMPVVDPMTGQPVMATQQIPPILQLSPAVYQWMLEDAAKLIKREQKKFLEQQAEMSQFLV